MRKNAYFINIVLAGVVGAAMLAMLLSQVIQPGLVLPVLNIPNLLGLCAAALVLAYLLAGSSAPHSRVCSALLAAVTFALLPLAAGEAVPGEIGRLAVAGGVVFAAAEFLFDSMAERLASGPAGKAAVVMTGLGLFLSGQAFAGMFL